MVEVVTAHRRIGEVGELPGRAIGTARRRLDHLVGLARPPGGPRQHRIPERHHPADHASPAVPQHPDRVVEVVELGHGPDLARALDSGVVSDDALVVLEVELHGVDSALVDEAEDAVAQLLVPPRRRAHVDAPEAGIGHRNDDRCRRDVAGLVDGFERDRARRGPRVRQREAPVVVDLDLLTVGPDPGPRLDPALHLCGRVDRHRLDHGRHIDRRRRQVHGEAPGETGVVEHRARHRQHQPMLALRQLGRGPPHHGGALDRRLLDGFAVEAQRRSAGVGARCELDLHLEGGRSSPVERGAVLEAGLLEVDPGGPIHEHGDERDRGERHDRGEDGARLDPLPLLAEHGRPDRLALLQRQRARCEVEPAAAPRTPAPPLALAQPERVARPLVLGPRDVAQRRRHGGLGSVRR